MSVAEATLKLMNRAFLADPNAIHSLICNQVPCNKALSDDKHIVVDDHSKLLYQDEPCPRVGLLGIINGILLEDGSTELLVAEFQDLKIPLKDSLHGSVKTRRILVGFGLKDKKELGFND